MGTKEVTAGSNFVNTLRLSTRIILIYSTIRIVMHLNITGIGQWVGQTVQIKSTMENVF